MGAPLSVIKNDYRVNRKNADIMTPEPVSQFIYDTLNRFIPEGGLILDPCCGTGNLLKPWMPTYRTIGIDVKSYGYEALRMSFYRGNFLEFTAEEFASQVSSNIDLVICNPPFNRTIEWSERNPVNKRGLIPDIFLKQIFKLLGDSIPVVLFTPMGFRLNQRKVSKRFRYYRDECGADITSIVSLPLDIFPEVEFHMELLIWNIRGGLRPHYFLDEQYLTAYNVKEDLNGKEIRE